jgi:myo-inositol-1(or 4)-monophosphatase
VGEESFGGSLPEPPFWIADPLDGTNNFAFDFPFFCVTAAFVDASGPLFCCTFDPVRNESFTAFRGAGARLNGNPANCSGPAASRRFWWPRAFPTTEVPATSTPIWVCWSTSSAGPGESEGQGPRPGPGLHRLRPSGRYWEQTLRPWDMAAGVLLVREAGGVAGAYEGGEWSLDSRGVCAAGNRLWNPVREGIETGRRGAPFSL